MSKYQLSNTTFVETQKHTETLLESANYENKP
jgi:hypothetical protein